MASAPALITDQRGHQGSKDLAADARAHKSDGGPRRAFCLIEDVLIGSNYKEKVSWMSAKGHSSGRGISWNTARQCLEIPVFGKSGEHGPKTADGGGAEEVLQLVLDKKTQFLCIVYCRQFGKRTGNLLLGKWRKCVGLYAGDLRLLPMG